LENGNFKLFEEDKANRRPSMPSSNFQNLFLSQTARIGTCLINQLSNLHVNYHHNIMAKDTKGLTHTSLLSPKMCDLRDSSFIDSKLSGGLSLSIASAESVRSR
jgi:hypothetical protein